MIFLKKISSNKSTFKEVSFQKGFNVVVAERTDGSTEKDSRNSLGKSTLIEIIHFCLGSDFKKSSLDTPDLAGWIFRLDFELNEKEYTVSREVDQADVVFLKGDFSEWPKQPVEHELEDAFFLTNDEWCLVLGQLVFSLPSAPKKYNPSFRGVISYFARRGLEGYNNPFIFFRAQPEWSKQTYNSFLLCLGYTYAGRFQKIKDDLDEIKKVKKITGQSYFRDLVGSIGELEAEKINKANEIKHFAEQLKTFKIHPQYEKMQADADRLTKKIQTTLNDRHIDEVLVTRYRESSEEEGDVPTDVVTNVYAEAGLHFGDHVVENLENVNSFHKAVLTNRKSYLSGEIERLTAEVAKKGEVIKQLTDQRAEIMAVLQSHGALEEYTKMSGQLSSLEGELKVVNEKIENLKAFDERKTELEVQRRDLVKSAKQDKEERSHQVEAAITLFNETAQQLYSTGGTLAIGVGDSGYSFKIDIRGSRSQGISYMKVFCYDLTFTQLQAKFLSSCFLIHDSTVFDGVDERQFARALEYVSKKSAEFGFQYICMLNSDIIPTKEFSDDFKKTFKESIRLTLTDDSPAGSLLGIRFE